MVFIKREELLTYIEEGVLDALTSKNNNILDNIEKYAISEIDGYISGKYNTDVMFAKRNDKRNPYLISLVIDIMLFQLYARTTSDNIPEIKTSKYAKAIEYLENVAKGKITPNYPVKNNKYDSGSSQILFGGLDKINNTQI